VPRTTQEIAIDIGQQRELLRIYRDNLHHLRLQAARYGANVPLITKNEIDHAEQELQQLEEQIARLELEAAEVARTVSQAERERQLVQAFLMQRADAEGITTDRPVALAICLIPNLGSIKTDVEAYLRGKGWTMPVYEIVIAGINQIEDIARLTVGLQQQKLAFQDSGYTEMHLFIAGPIVAGVAAGGIFDNWKPVKLYHRASNMREQSYEYWMPLIPT
jgi:hypothetical protein